MVTGAVWLGKGDRRGTVTQGMGLTGTKAKALSPRCLLPSRCLQWTSLRRRGSSRPPSPSPTRDADRRQVTSPDGAFAEDAEGTCPPLARAVACVPAPWRNHASQKDSRAQPKHIGYSVTSLLSRPAPNETVTALDSLFILQGQLRAVQEENCQLPAPPLLSHAFCKCKQDHAIAVDTETPPAKRSSSTPEHPELPAGTRLSRTLLHRAAPGSLTEPISSRRCGAARPVPGLGAQAARLLPLPRFP